MYEIVYHWWEVFSVTNQKIRQHYVLPTKYSSKEAAQEVANRYKFSRNFIYKLGDRISVRKARA